ncbi:MAG: biotin--[acetyl-CoA-carboxylase] ligase [Pseudomonadota bacterium]|jgi:BirA family biotin operon repressor/biotin-[acetyl-CoA-carboxylase] ligase
MKPLSFSILRLLAEGEFLSGEAMARQLNVSRATVWNALHAIDDAGVSVHKVRGRGYRLAEPLQWLDKQRVLSALGDKSALFDLEVADSVESTNSVMMRKAALGTPHGSVLAAELQTGGRGRRGRAWHANLGGGLTFSLLWHFNQGAGFLSGLSLAVGVALVRALKQAGIADAGLKWPNDVLHRDRKLAGILIELQGDMQGPSAAVIGIGLNLKLSEGAKSCIDQAATDIHSITGRMPDRNQMLALILGHLAEVLAHFEVQGFASLRAEWAGHHVHHGKPVRLVMPDGAFHEGRLADVAEDGALLLETAGGVRRYVSGEISLRGAE